MKRHLHRLAIAGGAALLATVGAIAQPADGPPPPLQAPAPPGPAPKTNAEAAAKYKDVKVQGESAPDPKRPAGGNTNTAHPITDFVPVTDPMLRNPDPANWIMARGNYQGWGFSKLDQINKSNIKNLRLVWSRLMGPGQNENTPIVYNGIMYLPNDNDVIQAIDAASGEVLWQYRRRLPSQDELHLGQWGTQKRSIFLYGDKLYTTTRDNFLVALDAKTGKEVWQVDRGGDYYATNSTGPIVVNGVVLAGSQCQVAPFGCYVDAHDAQTGKQLWRNELIPHPGQPGDETWGGKPFNERWITDVWGLLTYDPDVNILYYGSSGVGPASEAQRNQIGATLMGSDTRFAVNPQTGKIIWQHQVLPNDNWDQDCTFEMMPITTPVHPDANAEGMFSVGRGAASASRKTLTGMPCKTGVVWSLDALTGNYLWAKSTVLQNIVAKIDDKGTVSLNTAVEMRDVHKTYHVCPSYVGGRDWPFTAYSPQTNTLYAPMENLCGDVAVRSDRMPSLANNDYNTTAHIGFADGKTDIGRIEAVNVETGKTAWNWENKTAIYSPLLVTAGGFVFSGGLDRNLRAHDQTNGEPLWQVRLGAAITAAPISFSVKGRQYIAVAGGGGAMDFGAFLTPQIDQPSGNNEVYVFALPE